MRRTLRCIGCCGYVAKETIVSVVCLVTAALFSCAKMTLEVESPVATGIVPIVVENSVAGAGPARAIAPTQLTTAGLSTDYTFKLTGSMGRMTLPEQTLALDATGRTSLTNVSDGTWHLTITASTKTAPVMEALSGSATVTVRNGSSDEARFTLTPVETGSGTVRVQMTFDSDDVDFINSVTGRKVSLALYDVSTDEMVAATEALWTNTMVNSFTYTAAGSSEADGSESARPSGMYELRLTLTGGGVMTGKKVQWRDVLYIEPGRKTTGTVAVPRLIARPASPAAFAGTCTQLTAAGTYDATLGWSGVYNANTYQLEIMRYTAGTAMPTDDGTWNTAGGQQSSSVYTYNATPADANNYTNPTHSGVGAAAYSSGGLLPGQTSMAFKMRMNGGEGFAARIRAQNDFGDSAWAYLQAPLVPDAPSAPSGFAFAVGSVDDADSFESDLTWTGGIFDAGGTYEMELQRFTGGTEPVDDNTWGQSTGSTSERYTSAQVSGANASVIAGGLGAGHSAATLKMNNTGGYYTARIRTVNSNGQASAWVYLGDTMVPSPAIPSHTSTAADKKDGYGNACWWAYITIWGPQGGLDGMTGLKMRWIAWRGLGPVPVVEDEATWDYLKPMNAGSQDNNYTTYGVSVREMRDMNPGLPFLFCIRTETSYGNSPWFFYRDVVEQTP